MDEKRRVTVRGGVSERPAAVARTTLTVLGVAALVFLAYKLIHVVLLAFAAVVAATILVSLAKMIGRVTRLGYRWSLVLAGVVITVLIAGFVVLLGAQIRAQITNLIVALPTILGEVGTRIGVDGLYERIVEQLQQWVQTSGAIQNVFGVTFGLVGVIADLLVVIVAGFYFAVQPAVQQRGLLQLFPRGARERMEVASDEAGRALQLWLVGQLIAMLLVGTLTTLGLTILGLPSSLALGFIAGIAEFVPMVGPFLAAVPALLVGLAEGPQTLLWVGLVFIIVQQVEGSLITPIVQRRAVDLPPVIALFGVIALGTLFGPLGVLLATPMAVVLLVLVKQLYIRDALHEETHLPGEKKHEKVDEDDLEEPVGD